MPYKRKNKKKVVKRRRQSLEQRLMRTLPFGGLPDHKWIKFRYVETIAMDPASTSYAQYNFLANDINDPNSTGTGHQPAGTDDWAALYDKCQVMMSKIKVQPLATTVSNTIPGTLIIHLSEDGTEISTLFGVNGADAVMESNRIKSGSNTIGIIGNESSTKAAYSSFESRKFYGQMGELGAGTLVGAFDSSPTEKAYYEVAYLSNADNNPGAMNFRVTVDYLVYCTEPKLPQSS